MNFTSSIKNQKVLILGLGLQGGGVGDALWLHQQGAKVRVTDLKSAEQLASSLAQLPSDISRTLGEHLPQDIDWADLIIKNPGVPDNQPQLQYAREQNKPIYTSIALVVQEFREKTIGITGTRGKTTTTELTYQLLNKAYPDQIVKGGNLADTSPLALFDNAHNARYLVLELSSFQLAGFHELKLSPAYAVLTNIYPDHLNRYKSMQDYQHDKSAIFVYQQPDDHLIVNGDNQLALELTKKAPANRHLFHSEDTPSNWQLILEGDHNRENIAGVIKLASILNIPQPSVQQLAESFAPVPFRLEHIREVGGVNYVNDTTSTTPTATIKAIQALPGPLTLIIGGPTKNLPIDEMIELVSSSPKVKHLIILGAKDNLEFLNALHKSCPQKIHSQVFSMPEAVTAARSISKPGYTVLLSPGFFSFDLFENEFDRGRQFNQAVNNLS